MHRYGRTFRYHRYQPARGSGDIFFTACERSRPVGGPCDLSKLRSAFWSLVVRSKQALQDLVILDGFDEQRRHSSEQCALSHVSRGVLVEIEVLTLTIGSRCVDEKSDFLYGKTRYVWNCWIGRNSQSRPHVIVSLLPSNLLWITTPACRLTWMYVWGRFFLYSNLHYLHKNLSVTFANTIQTNWSVTHNYVTLLWKSGGVAVIYVSIFIPNTSTSPNL